MRRCPVAAWEGWTTKRDIHEDSERAAEGNRRRPNLIQLPSVAIEAHSAESGDPSACSVSSRGSLAMGARREHGSRGPHILLP